MLTHQHSELSTRKHLVNNYREEYPRLITYILWVLAETAIIAVEIPEG